MDKVEIKQSKMVYCVITGAGGGCDEEYWLQNYWSK
jgi:hypothetical protein